MIINFQYLKTRCLNPECEFYNNECPYEPFDDMCEYYKDRAKASRESNAVRIDLYGCYHKERIRLFKSRSTNNFDWVENKYLKIGKEMIYVQQIEYLKIGEKVIFEQGKEQ